MLELQDRIYTIPRNVTVKLGSCLPVAR